jgi:uncharacterized protein YqgC (DUF456 family)
MTTPATPALQALTDQAFAAAADGRRHQHAVTIADAERFAAKLAVEFRGEEAAASRAVMAAAMVLGTLLARYEQFPGGLELVPVVLALAAEQVAREAGAR